MHTQSLQLSPDLPILTVPGIGRRTARLLEEAGVRTVGQFLALPDFLLTQTFGPSLKAVRQRTEKLLPPTPKPGAYTLMQSLLKFFAV